MRASRSSSGWVSLILSSPLLLGHFQGCAMRSSLPSRLSWELALILFSLGRAPSGWWSHHRDEHITEVQKSHTHHLSQILPVPRASLPLLAGVELEIEIHSGHQDCLCSSQCLIKVVLYSFTASRSSNLPRDPTPGPLHSLCFLQLCLLSPQLHTDLFPTVLVPLQVLCMTCAFPTSSV